MRGRWMNIVQVWGVVVVVALLVGCGGGGEPRSSQEEELAERGEGAVAESSRGEEDQREKVGGAGHGSPEEAVRALVLGMVARDEAMVRSAILPDEHAELLWAGEPMPSDELEPLLAQLDESMEVRRLEPGDKVPLPGGGEHVLTDDVLSEDRQMVTVHRDGRMMLAPLFVERTDDGWRVDAGPVIAAAAMRGEG